MPFSLSSPSLISQMTTNERKSKSGFADISCCRIKRPTQIRSTWTRLLRWRLRTEKRRVRGIPESWQMNLWCPLQKNKNSTKCFLYLSILFRFKLRNKETTIWEGSLPERNWNNHEEDAEKEAFHNEKSRVDEFQPQNNGKPQSRAIARNNGSSTAFSGKKIYFPEAISKLREESSSVALFSSVEGMEIPIVY